MDFKFKENVIPSQSELLALYNNVGWVNYTKQSDLLHKAYENSLFTITAWQEAKLIGAIRVVGDGYSIIYIQDILVLQEYQRMGIGARLLEQVLDKYMDVYQKVLLTDNDEKTKAFYGKLGFKASDSYGCVAFVQYKI